MPFLVKRYHDEKGSVRRRVFMMQQPVFIAKVRGEVFENF
jgi:hypothetical protein